MKMVEVSAICEGYAINPAGDRMYCFISKNKIWGQVRCKNALTLWSAFCANHKVHRGIFNIKVYGD